MQKILLQDHDMAKSLELIVDLMDRNEYPEYFAVGVTYREVTGDDDGVVEFYATNNKFDAEDYVPLGTLEIKGADNKLNKFNLEVLQHPFSELYIKYIANNVSAGKLSIDLYKKDF